MVKTAKRELLFFVLALTLTLALGCAFAPTAWADDDQTGQERRVVKVAYPEQQYLSEIGEAGNYDGYSYAYLKKIAEFANWELEYITYPDESLDDQILTAMSQVESGEADLLGVMLRNPALEAKYQYPENNYGAVYTTLEVLESNIEVTETTYMRKNPLRIAVLETSKSRNAELQTFATNSNLNVEYVYCASVPDQLEALENGSADALVNVSLNFLSGTKVIAEFAPRPFYFVSTSGNVELVAELDEAITKINETDPYFEDRLSSTYFQNSLVNFSLTADEERFVEENKELRVLLIPEFGPFAFVTADGELQGISVSILDAMAEKTGLSLNYHVLGKDEDVTSLLEESHYDIVVGPPYGTTFAARNSLVLSQPYLEDDLTVITHKDSLSKPKADCVLGLLEDVGDSIDYEYKEIRYYASVSDLLGAVNRNEVDYGYASRYVVDFYQTQGIYANVDFRNLSGYTRELGFYVPNTGNPALLSILNKYTRSLPIKDVHGYLNDALAAKDSDGVVELVRTNPMLVVVIAVSFLFLLLLVGMLIVYGRANKKRNSQLQAAFAAKSDFLSRMSHDMRTPMNGIIGLTGLTLDIDKLPEEAVANLRKIDESSKYLLSLINDTLDMNKIESNKIILSMEPTDLSTFFGQMISVAKVSADQKGVNLLTHCCGCAVPAVLLDKVRVQQVFFNLVSNAIKFTPEGGEVEVTWRCALTEEHRVNLTFAIRDTGIGISPEFIERVFEPFEQEGDATTGAYAGTGLGLSIAKSLVDTMGGTINVKSEKENGSEFPVSLSFAETDDLASPAVSEKPSLACLKGACVLLCEDHPLNARIARQLLEKAGMTVDCAVNGQEAVEAFTKSPNGYYDAVLMDVRMPVMDGLEATRTIRALDREDADSVPIIAMTANAFDEDVQKSKAAGMSKHLAKPVEPMVLYDTLASFISKRIV